MIVAAAFISDQGAAYSSEILQRFGIGESTLRRWRPALRRLDIEFVERGRWSFYARRDLLARYPTTRRPLADRKDAFWDTWDT